jgi:O-antigen/teichoic acid export membrane protein
MNLVFWVLENYQRQWLTNGLSEIRMTILIITIVIGLWAVLGVWRGKTERFITAAHAVGFSVYLETVYKLWGALDDINTYWGQIARTGSVYIVTLIITIFFVFVISKQGKGVKKGD